jgi:hypothetical protein
METGPEEVPIFSLLLPGVTVGHPSATRSTGHVLLIAGAGYAQAPKPPSAKTRSRRSAFLRALYAF